MIAANDGDDIEKGTQVHMMLSILAGVIFYGTFVFIACVGAVHMHRERKQRVHHRRISR